MPENLRDYLEGSWHAETLFAESVPHLLHWDLAYLWVLERDPRLRPTVWQDRVAAWEILLQLLLAGRLRIETRSIPPPLSDFTARYGVREVHLLFSGDDRDPVGALSPTVLVRPLPEADVRKLTGLRLSVPELAHASHCLEILKGNLTALVQPGQARQIQVQLQGILETLNWGSPQPCDISFVEVPLAREIRFFAAPDAALVFDSIQVPMAGRGDVERVYVPRCSRCHDLLTTEDGPQNACEVVDDRVDLQCSRGHMETLPLERLFVWRRQTDVGLEYIYWTDRRSAFPAVEDTEAEWPPVPDVVDGQLRFRWNPGRLGGETQRVALRLRFPPEARLRGARVRDECLYRTLLVPGEPNRYTGLPIRWKWRDAWEGVVSVVPDRDCIHYRGVRLRGLPFVFHWPYTNLSLRVEKSLFPGIYPKRMHSNWKPYRVAALSSGTSRWSVKVKDGQGPLSCVKDTEGWPDWVSVECMDDPSCGASWFLRDKFALTGEDQAPQETAVNIGVDFGTSASVIYYSFGDNVDVTTNLNAIHLDDFSKLMYWLGPMPPESFYNDGWFLPRGPERSQDPCLIPSALWIAPLGESYIRWANQPPGDWTTSHAFKWDDDLQDRSAQRKRFLHEVAFFSIPCIFERLGKRQACPQLRVGFAYPLAFSFQQRKDYRSMLDDLKSWLQSQGGFKLPAITSLNESLAAIRAYGEHNPGEQFLIADMGGRTLDVALFAYASKEACNYYQIGSLDFGGEIYLNRVTESGGQTAYWELWEHIFSGRIASYGANADMTGRLDRFQIMALEFLRTMLACHRVDDERPVKLILIGNGWRLRDLTAGKADPIQNFRAYFQRMLGHFELPGVELLDVDLSGIESSKHWVAVGALRWAARGQADELDTREFYGDKLPAGRNFTIAGRRFQWYEMVGMGGESLGDPTLVGREPTECELESGPTLTKVWRRQLDGAVPSARRYPDMARLRDWLHGSVTNDKVLRGPLSLIVEKHWKGLL
jgi:hypothetical protein